MQMMRNRAHYLVLVGGVVILGLLSRGISGWVPRWTGDILWGLMVFFLMGFVFRDKTTINVATIAVVFSIGVEAAKLYHAPWIEAFRYTKIGGLILGYVFSWSNVLLYIAGITVGFFCEHLWIKTHIKQ